MAQEELERNIVQNYYNLNQNKYHMSIGDIQRTLAHQQALQIKHQELQDLQLQHQFIFDGHKSVVQRKIPDRLLPQNPLDSKTVPNTKTERNNPREMQRYPNAPEAIPTNPPPNHISPKK